jgi:ADP-ribose pyrophosphatase YjhB (NUDIX family)
MLTDPGYKFCPKCGSPLARRRLKDFEPERLVCTQCLFVMYLNPKVAAGTVVEHRGGIVLLRREIDPRAGFWVHPGGFVDRGETLEQAAIRETREEVGLEVEILGLLGAFSFHDSEVVVVTYAARTISGEPKVGDESLEVRTFDRQELPWDELAFPSTRLALKEYLRTVEARQPLTPDRAITTEISAALVASALWRGAEPGPVRPARPVIAMASEPGRLEVLTEARAAAFRARDVRAASLVYPQLIDVLRGARRYKEALEIAEEGLALTHDPLIARLADEVAHDLAESETERC